MSKDIGEELLRSEYFKKMNALAMYCQSYYDLYCVRCGFDAPMSKECHDILVENGMTGKKTS
jgi:hypothetical protein